MRKVKRIAFRIILLCIFFIYIALASMSHTIDPREILKSPWFQESITKVIMRYSGEIIEEKKTDILDSTDVNANDADDVSGNLIENGYKLLEELPFDFGALANGVGEINK